MIDIGGNIGGIPNIYLVLLCGLPAVMILFWLWGQYRMSVRRRNIKELFKNLWKSLGQSKERFSILEQYAKENLKDIDPLMRGEVNIARRLIKRTEQLLTNAEVELAEGTNRNISAAMDMLDTPLSEVNDPLQSLVTNQSLPAIYPHQVEETIEIIFQRISKSIAKPHSSGQATTSNTELQPSPKGSIIGAGLKFFNQKTKELIGLSAKSPEE